MRHILTATVFATALVGSPAYGQAWIGQIAGEVAAQGARERDARCMRGELPAPSDQTLARIRESAQQTMTEYAALAAAPTFDASSVFHRRNHVWSRATENMKLTDVTAITDPLMNGSTRVLAEPSHFLRAGDTVSAAGRWIIRSESGEVVGSYVGVFRRQRGRWLLTSLEVDERPQEPPPLAPYCHAVGDVAVPFDAAAHGREEATPAVEAEQPAPQPEGEASGQE